MDISTAHKFSSIHRESILKSKTCGCFYCLEIFSPNKIEEWCDEDEQGVGQTALCPKCGVDSLIGDIDVNFDKVFLNVMKKYWF